MAYNLTRPAHADVRDAIQEAVDTLSAKIGIKLTLGYIGNVWHNGPPESRDDRSWHIWVDGIVLAEGIYRNNKVSVGGFRTKDLGNLLATVEAEGIQKAIAWALVNMERFAFRDVKDYMGEVVETAAQVEAAVTDNPALFPSIEWAKGVKEERALRRAARNA